MLKRSSIDRSILVALALWTVLGVLPHSVQAMPMPGDGPPTAMDVSSNTGDATLRIPIPVPPGTGSFEPELALRYASSNGDGPFGVGWTLEFGEIRRSIRFGVPAFVDALDRFEVDGQLLVVNPADSNANQTRYHTATESFVRIYHFVAPFIDWWEATRPDGTKLRFGLSEASRVRKDGSGPIFRWLLEEMVDPYGNTIKFTHFMQGGEAYPLRAEYTFRNGSPVGTLRTVEFIYQTRPDPSLTFMGGVRRELTLRADRIDVKTGSTLFRKLEMTYAGEAGAGKTYLTGRSRLASVQSFGVGGTDALPPQKLEYRDAADDPVLQGSGGHWGSRSFPVPAGASPSSGGRIAQVNADGYPDLVVANFSTKNVYLGTGNGWNSEPDPSWSSALQAVTATTSILATVQAVSTTQGSRACKSSISPSFSEQNLGVSLVSETTGITPFFGNLANPSLSNEWTLVDVTGDGRADLLRSAREFESYIEYDCGSSTPVPPVHSAGTTRRDVWVNTGSGWVRDVGLSDSLPPFSIVVVNGLVKKYDLDPRFADLDDDGRLDLIVMVPIVQGGGASRVYVARAYRSTPGGWVAMPDLDPPTPHRLIEGDDRLTPGAYRNVDRAVEFVDLNRDGLSDTVKTTVENPGTCSGAEFTQAGVWLNAADSWCDGNGASLCSGATAQYLPPTSFKKRVTGAPGCNSQSAGVTLADLNGDGLLDLLRTDGTTVSGQAIAGGKRSWIHNPQALGVSVWQQRDQFTPPLATIAGTTLTGQAGETGVQLTDADVDGALDLVDFGSGGSSSVAGGVRFSDLLSGVENGRGGIIDYVYQSAVKQQDGILNVLTDQIINDADGTVSWTTDPVLVSRSSSGIEVQPVTVELKYAQPRVFVPDRMSQGFAAVLAILPDKVLSQSLFEQRQGLSGRPRRTEILSLESLGVRSRTDTVYEVLPGGAPAVGAGSTAGAWVGRPVSQTTRRLYGANPNEIPGAVATQTFEYDAKNSDPFAGYGFVTRTTTTRPTGTLVRTRRMRAPDTTRWIVGLSEQVLLTSGSSELAKTSIDYSNEGSPTQITGYEGPRGNLASATPRASLRAYDVFGNLRSVTDPASRTTEICYDGDTIFPSGISCSSPTTETTHGIAIALRDPLEQITTFQPDPLTGRIVQTLRMYSGDRDKAEFDAFGRPERTLFQPVGASDIVLSETDYFELNEDPAAPQEHAVTYARIQTGSTAAVRTASYLDGFGNPVRRVDEAPLVGGQARYLGVATQQDLAALQSTTTYPATCGANEHCPGLFSGSQPRTATTRDALNRGTRIETPDGVSQFHYRSLTRSHPDVGPQSFDAILAMDARGYLTQRTFDGDRVVWVEECTNAPISDPGNVDLSSITCQSPAVTFYRYAPTGELSEIYGALTSSYGNPATATLRYVYDSLGRVTEAHDINKTAPTLTSYNAAGNVQQTTNARGQAVVFDYDDLDRTTTINYPGFLGSDQYLFEYDERTRDVEQIELTTTLFGTATVFVQDFTYDALGRLSQEDLAYLQHSNLITEQDRDLLGRTTRVRYPDLNTEVAYEYEGAYLKRVCELGSASSCTATEATPYLSDVQYDAIGREIAIAGSNENEIEPPTQRFTYDPSTYRLEHLQVDTGYVPLGGETLNVEYDYDAVGNVLGITDESIVLAGGDVSFSATYTYDARGRIASRARAGQTKHFNYDAVGNLIGKAVDTPGGVNQQYDAVRRHRVIQAGGMSYTYDADGNVTLRGAQDLFYDALGRIRCIEPLQGGSCDPFTYGPDGIRVAGGGQSTPLRVFVGDLFEWEAPTGDATARIYALGRQVAYKKIENATLRTGAELYGTPIEHFLPPILGALAASAGLALLLLFLRWGLGQAIAARPAHVAGVFGLALLMATPSSAWAGFTLPSGQGTYRRWVWEDPLGSGVHITDDAGFAVHQRAFEPFGEVASERNSESTDRTFAGHQFESALGLYYMKARWYDPLAGRFLSTDPIVRDATAPQSLNAYSYVENRPTVLTDPSGTIVAGPQPLGLPGTGQGGVDKCFTCSGVTFSNRNSSILYEDGARDPSADDEIIVMGDGGLGFNDLVDGVVSFFSDIGGAFASNPLGFLGDVVLGLIPFSDAIALALNGDVKGALRSAAQDLLVVGSVYLVAAGVGLLAVGVVGYGLFRGVKAFRAARAAALAIKFSQAETQLLRRTFGIGPKGARAILKQLEDGTFSPPSGLQRSTLEKYRQVAEKSINEGKDKIGSQDLRLQIIDRILRDFGDQF